MRLTQEKVLETFNKNVDFLSRYYPQLLEKLNIPKDSIRVSLDPQGRIDAFIGSLMVYGGDAYKKSLEQVYRFDALPIRFMPNLHISSSADEKLISYRTKAKMEKVVGTEIKFPQYPPDKNIPLLISIGLGFGFHIDMLRKMYKIQHMIIIDLPIFAHLSLYTMDWKDLVEEFNKQDKSITLFIGEDFFKPETIDNTVQELINAFNRIGPMLTYWGYYFEHLKYNPPVRFSEFLAKTPAISQLYKGFCDDELWSLEWTLEKIERSIPAYYGGYTIPRGYTAFVLGAGPSLDKAIEFIQRYKGKAVIFSCGSTITALERVGILPDYHVETERTKYTYDILAEVNREFLKDIIFITNNPTWTECFDLFKEGYMFLKLNDTGGILLAKYGGVPIRIRHTGPTVTAGGVALAAEFGFEEIYLFGVDLGKKATQEHHSKLTNYYKSNSMLSKMVPELDIPYEAVNGGLAYTNIWFLETAQSIEAIARKFNVRIYNASDGINISGTIPIRLEDINMESKPEIDKEYIKSVIRSNFSMNYTQYINRENMGYILTKVIEQVDELIAIAKRYTEMDYRNYTDLLSYFTMFNYSLKHCDDVLYHLIFHDTHTWTTAVVGASATVGPEERDRLVKEFWHIYIQYLREIKEYLEALRGRFAYQGAKAMG